jgi:lipopolysaccharide export LptBFGC system permease protein LptF
MSIGQLIRTSMGLWVLLALVVLTITPAHAAKAVNKVPTGKNRDLAVLDYERWIDTLKGTVKNFSKSSARDVTVVVKFLDKKKKALGTQRVGVGNLQSGDQGSWSLAIEERNRSATNYVFEVHAIWQ